MLPPRTTFPEIARLGPAWASERLRALGDSPNHQRFWAWMDRLATAFWGASRAGIKLPLQRAGDVFRAIRCLGLRQLPLARYLRWTMGDALLSYSLREDRPLAGLLSMLLEDTVHNTQRALREGSNKGRSRRSSARPG